MTDMFVDPRITVTSPSPKIDNATVTASTVKFTETVEDATKGAEPEAARVLVTLMFEKRASTRASSGTFAITKVAVVGDVDVAEPFAPTAGMATVAPPTFTVPVGWSVAVDVLAQRAFVLTLVLVIASAGINVIPSTETRFNCKPNVDVVSASASDPAAPHGVDADAPTRYAAH